MPEPRRVTCRNPICQQVIAHERANGSIKPKVDEVEFDELGRCVVICAACGTRNRLQVRRRAA